jgi:cytochrome P450
LELKTRGATGVPRVYELRKGAVIAMPSSLLHHDLAIHVEPEVFNPERFLPRDLGGMGTQVSSATLRPFGGGISYCPGRVFAEKQVTGFLAGFLVRYNFTVAGGGRVEAVEVPKNADFFYVTKEKNIELVLRKQELKEC